MSGRIDFINYALLPALIKQMGYRVRWVFREVLYPAVHVFRIHYRPAFSRGGDGSSEGFSARFKI